ncbi:hypothetical protein AB0395_34920 [Streptosporangium sp. NPDC051023]|uniref:hypothetical protein n=1 Tax=Streptosporangium sp. NPDC051023 TaxID=3155410 RepID=UPI00344B576C
MASTIPVETAETLFTTSMNHAFDAQAKVRARLAEEIAEQVEKGTIYDLSDSMRTVIAKDAEAAPWHRVASYRKDGRTLFEAVRCAHTLAMEYLIQHGISISSDHISNHVAIADQNGLRRFVADVAPILRAAS